MSGSRDSGESWLHDVHLEVKLVLMSDDCFKKGDAQGVRLVC